MTNVKNESRLFKETKTIVQNDIADNIFIAGLWKEGLKVEEVLDTNRTVYRVQLKSRNLPKNLFVQLFKYMEFTFHLLLKYRKKRITMVNIHSLALLPIGSLFKLFYGTKLIYDAHEYETETQNLNGIKKKLAKILERVLIKQCDKVIVVSDAIADEYVKLYNIEKPAVVLNTPPLKKIEKKDIFRQTLNISKNKTIFLYQGGLNSGRGIEILLETFMQIDDNKSVIVFMGYGSLEELIKTRVKKYENIYFHPAVSPDILLDYTSSADFGILFYENNCLNHYYCSPNKMFEYLMAEIPVIVSNLYEMRRLVEDNKIGVVAKENTPQGLKEAIKEAIKLDKEKLKTSIKNVKTVYNWENQEKVLLEVYEEL
jgi:glycosyltransferase involved in cell wall biosynthesis